SVEPEDRYADGAALLAALGGARVTSRAPSRPAAAGKPSRGRALAIAAIALSIAGVAAVGALRGRAARAAPGRAHRQRPAAPPPIALHPNDPRRITFSEGCEEFPAFTPDGRAITFDQSDAQSTWIAILRVDDLSVRPLTTVRGWDYDAHVSPDGK